MLLPIRAACGVAFHSFRAGARLECLAGEGLHQEIVCRQFLLVHMLGSSSRQQHTKCSDFRHGKSQEVLLLDKSYIPAWVDEEVAAQDVQKGRGAPTSRPAEYPRDATAETVSILCEQGQLSEAVEALGVLVQTGCCVPDSVFYAVLKKCMVQRDLVLGRRVHALIVKGGYESDTFLCNHILRMYVSHGRLQDAMDVFAMVATPDAFTWSAIISALMKHRQDKRAIQLYHQMHRTGVKPDGHVFVAALQACARGGDLKTGQQVHGHVLSCGLEHDVFVCNSLVDMYAKCGSLDDAQRVFDGLVQKDVVTWNAMIAGYSQQGMGQEALRLYSVMEAEGIAAPDSVTYVSLLQACASLGTLSLEVGRQLHAQIRELGLHAHVFVANSLINMYAKCGSLTDAQRVFDQLGQKDVVTWTALIAGYANQGSGQEALHLYRAMQNEGIAVPNAVTFMSLLQACASVGTLALEQGKQLHAQIEDQGLKSDVFVANTLVDMYAKCGSLEDAQRVFDGLSQRDVVMWTTLIAGYSEQGMGEEALHHYCAMQKEGIAVPNAVTFVSLLQACACVGTLALEKGKQLHAQIIERGLEVDVVVGCSLVNMYTKCGSLEDAQLVFDGLGQKNVVTWTTLIAGYANSGALENAQRMFERLSEKDVVTWNAMIAGYSQQGMGQEALRLYSSMQDEGMVAPNSATFVCLLQACASVGTLALEKGKQLHAEIRKQGHQADVLVANSLVDMYAKCGSLEDAQRVFDGLSQKGMVTWTAMIAGYSQHGMGQEALRLYSVMQEEGITAPDSVTFVCLLQACARVGTMALDEGKELHAQIQKQGLLSDVLVANSLVNMYAKCGSLEDAQGVFDGLSHKNMVTWSVMIAGYSQQGMGQEALRLYRALQEGGIVLLDSVTCSCLLQACANLAALHLGRQLHALIVKQGLQADALVTSSLINMYGKCGSMNDAQQVFEALPERDVVAWNALIAGYARQGDTKGVFDLFHRMKEDCIQPTGITFLSVLTVCSHAGLVDKGQEYFQAMSRHHGITPTVEQYTCMVDLMGRAGQLDDALALVRKMPVLPTAAVWHTLLAACQKWSNLEVGRHAFNGAVKLDKSDAAAYVLMSNIYTGAGMWEQAQEMQARRIELGIWKQPGQSWWTDISGRVHKFSVGHTKHPESEGIYARLRHLLSKIKKERYVSHHFRYPAGHPQASLVS